jgi:hypothetical protein
VREQVPIRSSVTPLGARPWLTEGRRTLSTNRAVPASSPIGLPCGS